MQTRMEVPITTKTLSVYFRPETMLTTTDMLRMWDAGAEPHCEYDEGFGMKLEGATVVSFIPTGSHKRGETAWMAIYLWEGLTITHDYQLFRAQPEGCRGTYHVLHERRTVDCTEE